MREDLQPIKNKLSTLVKIKGTAYYMMSVGRFDIRVFTNDTYSEPSNVELSSLVKYKMVSVAVDEYISARDALTITKKFVVLLTDYRFKDFCEDLKITNEWGLVFGLKYFMGIDGLCKLIYHMERLNDLDAFY